MTGKKHETPAPSKQDTSTDAEYIVPDGTGAYNQAEMQKPKKEPK